MHRVQKNVCRSRSFLVLVAALRPIRHPRRSERPIVGSTASRSNIARRAIPLRGHPFRSELITEHHARPIAERFVHDRFGAACRLAAGCRFVRFGWFIRYDLAAAFAAGDPALSLLGTAPIFVDARNGATFALAGPVDFWDHFLAEYERRFVQLPASASEPIVSEMFEAWRRER